MNDIPMNDTPSQIGHERVSGGVLAKLAALVPLMLASAAASQSGAIAAPFVAGTGQWSTLSNGGFESGLTEWGQLGGFLGTMVTQTQGAAIGTQCAELTPVQNFVGNGFALVHTAVPVVPGQQYVLSGFLRTDGMTSGRMRLDLNRVAWEISPGLAAGSTDWVFVWDTVTIPATIASVIVRVVRDKGLNLVGEPGFADEIALTPLASFVPPMSNGGASVVAKGVGCDGLVLGWSSLPAVGSSTFSLVVANVPAVSPVAFVGLGASVVDPGVALGPIGMTGCFAFATLEYGLQGPVTVVAGSASLGLPIPNSPGLVGTTLAAQGLSFSGATSLGLAVSNGLALTIGN